MSKGLVSALIFLFVVTACLADDKKNDEPKAPQSIADLRQQLEKILKDTHTPGVSVAIVRKDGPEWVAGVGTADVASNRPADADTLYAGFSLIPYAELWRRAASGEGALARVSLASLTGGVVLLALLALGAVTIQRCPTDHLG